jgi:hypothetical protein
VFGDALGAFLIPIYENAPHWLDALACYEQGRLPRQQSVSGQPQSRPHRDRSRLRVAQQRATDDRSGILLSVVIPTYNYGHLLGRVLDSVLSQLTDECELVVIDDGSSDETPKVLETISAGRPSGFRWLRQNNAGAAAARNAGLRASRGSHVLFLDADDQLLPGALAAICSAFRDDSRATVVIGGRLTRWPDGREKRHPPPRRVDDDPCRRVADHLLDKTLSVSHGAVAVARELVDRRPYPEAFRGREDIPVSAYWLACGRIKVIDIPLVRIHKHPDSLRHAVKVSESLEQALADEIFRGLPDECQKLKPSYLAQRYLALSRAAAQTGERSTARRHLLAALRADPGQLLARGQLRKLIKAWMGSAAVGRNSANRWLVGTLTVVLRQTDDAGDEASGWLVAAGQPGAVQLGDSRDDGETEAVAFRRGFPAPVETLAQSRQVHGRNAGAVVAHGQR